MRLIDLALVAITTMLLTTNQVLLKIWLSRYSQYVLPLSNFRVTVFFKPELIFCALAFLIAGGIWMTLLKRIDFGVLYPMISMSYVFGLLAAKFVFQERVIGTQWLGLVMIIAGIVVISNR